MNIVESYMEPSQFFSYPCEVTLKVVSACNLRCKHCLYYEEEYSSANDFSTDELLNLIKYLAEEINVLKITLTGGEPFLRDDLIQIIKLIKSYNISLEILTNGILITDEIANEISKFFNPKTDYIQVSLDGATEETHEVIRGKGTFQKTIESIKRLADKGINVVINSVTTSKNIEKLPIFYELFRNINIKKIGLSKFNLINKEQNYLVPDLNSEIIYTAELIKKMSMQPEIRLSTRNLNIFDFLSSATGQDLLDKFLKKKKFEKTNCHTCNKHEKIFIDAVGKVALCSNVYQEELFLGNIREESFGNIWEKRLKNPLFMNRNFKGTDCEKCRYISFCNGGCPYYTYLAYGNVNLKNPRCKLK
jgi:radical SAM protein with 4Fe4S-binding SPASM domain